MNIKGLLISHRGIFNNKTIPENSVAAFHKAKNLNIPIELDVQLTKDQKVIVFHDINLKRMCGIDKYIEDVTYQELQQLTLLSSKEKIPTLKEVLELIQGKVLIDIELKKTKNVEELCNKVLEEIKNYTGDVLVKSFQPNIVRYLKKHTTRPVGLLITRFPTSKTYSYFMSSSLLIQYCKPDFLAINKEIIKKKEYKNIEKKFLYLSGLLQIRKSWKNIFLMPILIYAIICPIFKISLRNLNINLL